MRPAHVATSAAVLLGVLAGGCFDYVDNCKLALTCPRGTGGTGGGDAGPPPGCIPSKSKDPVADACGIFVSATGDDSAAGTKEKPLKTIQAALAKGSTIYACAGAMPFTEAVTIGKAATLFGALDCASWSYDAAKKTLLTAAADAVPLTLTSAASGSEVRDFAINAVDATAAGGSSIALLDDHADLALDHVDVTAGKGVAGAAGAVQAQAQTPATANGGNGSDNAACTVTTIIPGGAGGTNVCDGTKVDGGNGGKGAPVSVGDQGGDGLPVMTPGNGGSGQTKTLACNMNDPKGAAGMIGPAGTGARGVGDVSASGYAPSAAAPGSNGSPGQGGGGGGGGRQCDMGGMFAGPSGGGGGAGGCAGAPGKPGQGGGSSIGILALGAKLTLATVTIATKDGGKGGVGGDGQHGGDGGLAGHAVGSAACDGGKGGQGGAGGPGGGGSGGHSAAIVVKGAMLPDLASTTIVHGNGAAGGTGGDMDMSAQTKGDDGLGCKALDFTDPQSMAACAK
jgi:hypothetical protein